MSELRRDPILRRWVIIAPEREEAAPRPAGPVPAREEGACPLCPGQEAANPHEIAALPATGGQPGRWSVRVTPDRRPLLHIEGELERRGSGVFDVMSAIGAHELVTETPLHDQHWPRFDLPQMRRVLSVYRDRYLDLKRDPRFRHIVVLKNHGAPWSRFVHQHSHILAMPFTPKRIAEELAGAREYFRMKERCVFCDVLSEELAGGTRTIAANESFVAFAPFASSAPFEIWLAPRQHGADFGQLEEGTIDALAELFLLTMCALDRELTCPSFSLALHTAPLGGAGTAEYHWHWELMPHLSGQLGLEWATGVHANAVAPEEAARRLRAAARCGETGLSPSASR